MENATLTKPQSSLKAVKKATKFFYSIEKWRPHDAHELYLLEKKCWAPWLQKQEKDFLNIATNYPDLQRLIRNKQGVVVAAMSVNRINWDGASETLPTWDKIAGGAIETSNFSSTYAPHGNTLCLMSMNVSQNLQGIGLAQKLIEELKKTAIKLKVKHIISSLRPTDYGTYKLEQLRKKEPLISFEEYCSLQTDKDKPYDHWLRSAFHQGMKQIGISKDSIVVTVDKKTFQLFMKKYRPDQWIRFSDIKWECGETGSWYVDKNSATYREDNLSVELPFVS